MGCDCFENGNFDNYTSVRSLVSSNRPSHLRSPSFTLCFFNFFGLFLAIFLFKYLLAIFNIYLFIFKFSFYSTYFFCEAFPLTLVFFYLFGFSLFFVAFLFFPLFFLPSKRNLFYPLSPHPKPSTFSLITPILLVSPARTTAILFSFLATLSRIERVSVASRGDAKLTLACSENFVSDEFRASGQNGAFSSFYILLLLLPVFSEAVLRSKLKLLFF